MTEKIPELSSTRKKEIAEQFRQVLDKHMDDFMGGRVDEMFELKDFAAILCVHPGHLSRVIKQVTGHHACHFYEQRILLEAKKLLVDQRLSIKEIAHRLDYDVSNFTKFFKRFMGITPSVYRKSLMEPH